MDVKTFGWSLFLFIISSVSVREIACSATIATTAPKTQRTPSSNVAPRTVKLDFTGQGRAITQRPPRAKISSLQTRPKTRDRKEATSLRDEFAWTAAASNWFRRVTLVEGDAKFKIAESWALAVDDHYLTLPASSLASAWVSPSRVRVLLENSNFELQLVSIDVLSNVALFWAPQSLAPSMPRKWIRADQPRAGESLVLFVSKNSFSKDATFLRRRGLDPYFRYEIDGGTASPRRASYAFDRNGRFVAMTEGRDLRQAGSGRTTLDLLNRRRSSASIGGEMLRQQIQFSQAQQTKSFLTAGLAGGLNWRALDCQSDVAKIGEAELATNVQSVSSRRCESVLPVDLALSYQTGVEAWTFDSTSAVEMNGAKLAEAFFKTPLGEFRQDSGVINQLTAPECGNQVVTNSRGNLVRVQFCTSALKASPGLNDTIFSVSSDENFQSHQTIVRLKGFNSENTKYLLNTVIEKKGG